ncbi:MAG: hypothetical protein P1Q69_12275 [Candidatus Thorarchaeota archaeon]|nr:hypothetical protein [Candidatus Thorarchaeota archaeon]
MKKTLQTIPANIIDYLLRMLLPQVFLFCFVLIFWWHLKTTYNYLSQMTNAERVVTAEDTSRIRMKTIIFRSELVVSWTIAGVATGWTATGVYLPPVVVFLVLGIVLACIVPLSHTSRVDSNTLNRTGSVG